ncbi:MAG: response regulator [Deltaproteobacteria bacterium]|nr:response regulator [Deltaproteobacteria bacterium]
MKKGRIKVLVIDDSYQAGKLVRDTFTRCSEAEVENTTTVVDALRKVSESRFDIIITEAFMPGISLKETVHYIKSLEINKNTPILVLSNFEKIYDVRSLNIHGVHSVMGKPLDAGELVIATDNIISKTSRD